ncbi:MAG: phosphate/phosphite/phosphonate ABC transporter substrate-binding protein [Rhodobacteraceae bacterium]|nr:phosphate/phosphite/phosphonate ABC transporter substrate-binding protein [Paracoccaceae bacterium]
MTTKTRVTGATALAIVLSTGTLAAQECVDPDTLVFSIIPTEETTQEVNLYAPVIARMREKTGKSIEFFMPTSYSSVVEAMLNGWVHVGVHGPNSYVIARSRDENLEVFATYAKLPGHLQEEGPGYRAVLITLADSGFDDIESLRGQVVALADPASTSGNLLARVVLQDQIAVELDDLLGRVVYSGGHDLSTLAVHEGRVDAAFVATHRFDNVVERDLVALEDFQVVWASEFIPQDPFVYRTDLCPDLREAIRDTFLTLHEDPEAAAFLANVQSARFVPMQDSDYDIIRQIAAAQAAQ